MQRQADQNQQSPSRNKLSNHLHFQPKPSENKGRNHHSSQSDSDQETDMRICQDCSKKVKRDQMREHYWQCKPLHECKYCQGKLPELMMLQHQRMCIFNPVAQAMRKEMGDSSYYSSSSSEQQIKEYQDEDGYWSRNPPNRFKEESEEEEEQPRERRRVEEPLFNIRPRREYTLSESSSEEDERTRFLRNEQEAFRVMPTEFYVQTLNTDIEGVTIAVSSEGRGGRILRRTLHNHHTGQHRTLTNHRFERHYRSHVIPNQNSQNSNGAFIISHHVQREQLNSMMSHISIDGLSEQQISALEVTTFKKEQEEDSCAICCSNYEQEESLTVLKCRHRFHDDCVGQWLRQNPLCPLCKTNQK